MPGSRAPWWLSRVFLSWCSSMSHVASMGAAESDGGASVGHDSNPSHCIGAGKHTQLADLAEHRIVATCQCYNSIYAPSCRQSKFCAQHWQDGSFTSNQSRLEPMRRSYANTRTPTPPCKQPASFSCGSLPILTSDVHSFTLFLPFHGLRSSFSFPSLLNPKSSILPSPCPVLLTN